MTSADGANRLVTDRGRFSKAVAYFCAFICIGFFAGRALADPAGRIYVDNVPIGNVGHVTYSDVDVEISADGTVHIRTNKGSVVTEGTPKAADTKGKSVNTGVADSRILEAQNDVSAEGRALKGRYWLVAQDLGTHPAGWTAFVILNGQTVGEFSSGAPRVIEVTSMLRKGENSARIDFRRATASESSGSASADDSLQILLAPGKVAEDQEEISLGYPIIVQQRSAIESQAAPEDLRFVLPPPILP